MTADRTATDFGSKLREARERRGVSVRDIANATKISAAALEALERNDVSKLPGGIFSRAFVRSYAVEVGLDPEVTIQEFIGAFPNDSAIVGQPTSQEAEDFDAAESRRRVARTIVRLLTVSIPIVALVLYFGSAGRRPVQPSAATPVASSAASPAAADTPTPPAATPAAPVATADPAVAAPERVPAPPPPVERPTPAIGSLPAPTDAAVDGAEVLTVGLAVRTPCVVSAIVDGRKAIDQVLRPGDRRTVAVRREIVLTVGDAAAVVMTLNGSEARPLGKAGEVVTARMNPANFRTYLPQR
jgi:cytoskeletal protein RodZ